MTNTNPFVAAHGPFAIRLIGFTEDSIWRALVASPETIATPLGPASGRICFYDAGKRTARYLYRRPVASSVYRYEVVLKSSAGRATAEGYAPWELFDLLLDARQLSPLQNGQGFNYVALSLAFDGVLGKEDFAYCLTYPADGIASHKFIVELVRRNS